MNHWKLLTAYAPMMERFMQKTLVQKRIILKECKMPFKTKQRTNA